MTKSWDPERYERQPLPHERWGAGVIRRAAIQPGDRVVDAGCGTGRDAEAALRELRSRNLSPVARATLLDSDEAMVRAARARFADRPESERPVIQQADLTEPWPLDGPFDVMISVAALHWIGDHRRVFANAASQAAPGARMHVDCGGHGNIACIITTATAAGLELPEWNFADVEETVAHLTAAGWKPIRVWLQEDPLVLEQREAFREFISTVIFHNATDKQIDSVTDRCPDGVIRYVRLNIDAVKAV